MKKILQKYLLIAAILPCLLVSCEKLIEIDLPINEMATETLFSDSATIVAAAEGLYSENLLSNPVYYYLIPFYSSAMADDSYHNVVSYAPLNENTYSPTTSFIQSLWQYPYQSIYVSNSFINGMDGNTILSGQRKNQYIGEAKYFRAYSYFVLVNFFGDVPLILTTDYNKTALQPRAPVADVYGQIIADLKDAEIGLAASTNSNNKLTKSAASALLARVYLYNGQWLEAETKANEVITTSGSTIEAIGNVFLRSSTETIFKITSEYASYSGRAYWGVLTANRSYNHLRSELLGAFEAGDLRESSWTVARTAATGAYTHSYKYKRSTNPSNTAQAEDFVMLRLAEQYLIRAEARAQQGGAKLTDAIDDLNVIRTRAGLVNLPNTLTQAQVLQAVEQERRVELFLEEGHRWWDMKRTGRIDNILGVIADKQWSSHKALLPIPDLEQNLNGNLTPNPGY